VYLNVCVCVPFVRQKYDMPSYKQNFMTKKLKKVKLNDKAAIESYHTESSVTCSIKILVYYATHTTIEFTSYLLR